MRIVRREFALLLVLPMFTGCVAPKPTGSLTQAFDGYWVGFARSHAGACSDQYSGGKNLRIQSGQGVWRTGNGSTINFDLSNDGTMGFKIFGSGVGTIGAVDGKFEQKVATLYGGNNYCTNQFTFFRMTAASNKATASFDGRYQGDAELITASDNMPACPRKREDRYVIVEGGKVIWNFSTLSQGFEIPIDQTGSFRADAGSYYISGSINGQEMLARFQASDCLFEYKLYRA